MHWLPLRANPDTFVRAHVEFETFLGRSRQFAARLPPEEAALLADSLVARDRGLDDRRLCVECRRRTMPIRGQPSYAASQSLLMTPIRASFYWVLHESAHDASVCINLQSSDHCCSNWVTAHEAGTIELFKMVKDEQVGPRAVGRDENVSPIGSATRDPAPPQS